MNGFINIAPCLSKINAKVINFVENIPYDNTITLVGEAVANIIEGKNIDELDFLININKYLYKIEYFLQQNPLECDIIDDKVVMKFTDLPLINLIPIPLRGSDSIEQTINTLDFDYCRCYYTKQNGFMANELCLKSIFTKNISHVIPPITTNRIIHAIKSGYSFSLNFWRCYQHLLINMKKQIKCEICQIQIKSNKYSWCNHTRIGEIMIPIKLIDLNVVETHQQTNRIKFLPKEFDLMKTHIESMICRHPSMDKNLNWDLILDPQEEKIIYLNADHSSYLRIRYLPLELINHALTNFDQMFNLHPPNKHKIIMYMKEVKVSRWQQCYLNTPKYELDILEKQSYMYSGYNTSKNNNELPELFQIYYDYITTFDKRYNQVVANWYLDKNDYIAYHSDCEIGMIPNAEISIISLYGINDGNRPLGRNPNRSIWSGEDRCRVFSIIPKNEYVSSIYQRINVVLRHGIILTLCQMQKDFKHGIEKTESEDVLPRLSLSFRQFEETST